MNFLTDQPAMLGRLRGASGDTMDTDTDRKHHAHHAPELLDRT
jgi:hypothetical protein